MAFSNYSTTPASNTTIGDSIYIGPNMARDDVREALQTIAADGRGLYDYALTIRDGSASGAHYYASQAAGEAATTTGEFFVHPDGVGGLIYRERTSGGSTIVAEGATTVNTFTIKTSGSHNGFLHNATPAWIGSGTVNNSSLPGMVLSRNITSSALNYHGYTDSSQLTFSTDVAYNSYDAYVNILGTGLMNHYAGYQSRPVKSGTGTLTNYFAYHADLLISAGSVGNYYAYFVQDPTALGGTAPGRVVGLLFNNIPHNYSGIGNPNYVIYSNGLAPTYLAGTVTSKTALVASTTGETTAGAMVHANTASGEACSIRLQQQTQNWWDWRIPAAQPYLSLFESVGGGTGTERMRITSGTNAALTPGADNTQDLGTAALSWRGVYADTGFYHTGVKVVGAQGAAVADATDAATVITQLNALLARCRAHGLIAT